MRKILVLALLTSSFSVFAKVDYLRVMFNRNGATNATIGWHQVSGDSAKVYYSASDFDPVDYKACENNLSVKAQNEFKGFSNRFVRLQNLSPDQAYYFVIVDSEGVSERYWFKTTPESDDARLSLIAGGDSRTRRPVRVNANKMVGKLVPHAVLFAGDYTDIDTYEKWKFWFEDWKYTYKDFDNRIIPLVTARGNHELSNQDLTDFFDCPSKKNFYSVKLGGNLVNVICLNTEGIFGFSQKKFLETNLVANQNMFWNLPVYHRACRPHVCWKMKMRGVKNIYRHWIDLFEKYGVRLVIECDSHITKTTWPIVKSKKDGHEDGFIRDDENGVVYAGEGCWGAPLRVVDCDRTWTKEFGSVNSFKLIYLDKNEIELRTIDYMNVDSVQGLTEANRFKLPDNVVVWNKENGGVLKMPRVITPIKK